MTQCKFLSTRLTHWMRRVRQAALLAGNHCLLVCSPCLFVCLFFRWCKHLIILKWKQGWVKINCFTNLQFSFWMFEEETVGNKNVQELSCCWKLKKLNPKSFTILSFCLRNWKVEGVLFLWVSGSVVIFNLCYWNIYWSISRLTCHVSCVWNTNQSSTFKVKTMSKVHIDR